MCLINDCSQGDASSDDDADATPETGSVEKLSKLKMTIQTEWTNKRPTTTTSKDDTSIAEKVRRKRKRNRTIDYADLPSGGSDTWCGKVAGYSQRKFEAEPVFATEIAKVKIPASV